MPPSGVKKGSKRARQYEHIRQGERERGVSESRAEEIAARTVNKERARSGEARTSSRTSTEDISSGAGEVCAPGGPVRGGVHANSSIRRREASAWKGDPP